MEIRQVEAFLAVAEELHFGRAAQKLHLAQPALSRLIRLFEHELRTELFERTTRKVRLTPSGEALVEPARAIKVQVDGVRRIARSAQQGEIGSVKVGFGGTTGYAILSVLAREVSREHPGISLDLRPGLYSGEALLNLRDGEIDLAVVSSPASPGIAAHLVSNETFMVAMPHDDALAVEERVRMRDLRDARFVAYPATHGSRVRDVMIALCADAGFVPHIAQEVPDPYSLMALVGAGVGVSIVPDSSRHIHVDGVVYRPLDKADTVLPIALAWRESNPSLALRAVVELAKKAFPAQRSS